MRAISMQSSWFRPPASRLVARHADADEEVVADGAATALENLETEAHAVGEAAAIAVAPAIHRWRPELLDESPGLSRNFDAIEIAVAGPADSGGIVVTDAPEVMRPPFRRGKSGGSARAAAMARKPEAS